MNNFFEGNRRISVILLSLFFLLLLVVYFLFFRPLTEEREEAEWQAAQLAEEVENLQKQADEADEAVAKTDIDDIEKKRLAKKIPIEPGLQEFLLSLQEIELVSESKIIDYSFTYDGNLPERQISEEVEEEGEDDENLSIELEEFSVEVEMGTEEEALARALPKEVRLITVRLELYSPDYKQLQAFLQEIEKQERIMIISHLEFQKPGEFDLLELDDESILTEIDVTTFYYED